jgi:hypothetical protein
VTLKAHLTFSVFLISHTRDDQPAKAEGDWPGSLARAARLVKLLKDSDFPKTHKTCI